MLHRHEFVRRVVAAGGGRVAARFISRQWQQRHPVLNGIDIGQVFLPGKHDAGDAPNRVGGGFHPPHPFRQGALPAGADDGIGSRLLQDRDGIGPAVQHLHIEKAVGLRHHVEHRFRADIQPRLCIDGIHIRAHDRAAGRIHQAADMDELIDGGPPFRGRFGVGRNDLGGVHQHQREGVEIRLFHQLLHTRCSQSRGLSHRQKRHATRDSGRRGKMQELTSGQFHGGNLLLFRKRQRASRTETVTSLASVLKSNAPPSCSAKRISYTFWARSLPEAFSSDQFPVKAWYWPSVPSA